MKQVLLLAVAVMAFVLTGCQEKKQPYNIIVKKEKAVSPSKPLAMGDYKQDYPVEWAGKSYTVKVDFKADTSLQTVSDGSRDYYDNRIAMTIEREDGSSFFSHEFVKSDFSEYVDADYLAKSALLGIVYDKADNDHLVFAASVGSPDKSSDDYVPFVLKISRAGNMTVSKDTRIGTGAMDEASDDDAV